jgi:hypothetical protein
VQDLSLSASLGVNGEESAKGGRTEAGRTDRVRAMVKMLAKRLTRFQDKSFEKILT